MIKKILAPLLFVFALGANSQTISSIVLAPPSPDSNDTLKFYIYCDFPYMSCDGSAVGSISGFDISAYGHHCMGMLTALCSDVDTIVISPQSAGNYHFYFTLDAGFGGPPCSPPFTPNDYDTLDFTISPILGLNDETNSVNLSLFPNPSNGIVKAVMSRELSIAHRYYVRNEIGSLICSGNIRNELSLVLESGIYFISIPSMAIQQKIIVVK